MTGKIFQAPTKMLSEQANDFGRVAPNTNPEIINDLEFNIIIRPFFATDDRPR